MNTTVILVLAAVAAVLLPIGWKFLHTQILKIKNEKLRNAINEVADAAEAAAEAALDTLVVEAKKQNGGKLPKEAGKAIKEQVVESAIKSASKATTKVLVKEFADDDLKERVGNLVEVGLSRVKERRGLKKKKKTKKS